MMDFTLGEREQAVADLAAEVLDGGDPWQELAGAGLLALGGDGLGVLEVAVLLTEIGRRAAPGSLKALTTLMTGAPPLARWGGEDLRRAWLPGVAAGALGRRAQLGVVGDAQRLGSPWSRWWHELPRLLRPPLAYILVAYG